MTRQEVRAMMKALNQKPIAYYPAYRKITGTLTAAVLLSQLMYWYAASGNSVFYKTDDEIMNETGLTEKELRNAKTKIKEEAGDIVKIYRKKMPATTHYEIDEYALAERLAEEYKDDSVKVDEKNDEGGSDEEQKHKERKVQDLNKEAKEIIEHLNESACRNFATTGKPAEANLRMIKARLKEGRTVEECKKVIDYKVAKWGNDYEMRRYLRPGTLFRPSKFYDYLEEATEVSKDKFDVELSEREKKLYEHARDKFKLLYPNLYKDVGFMKASEFLRFIAKEPDWFPKINTFFSKNYKQNLIQSIFKRLENDTGRAKNVIESGGLFEYVKTRLLETATLA